MLCFLKRVLPFTLTLAIGLGLGSLFNLFQPKTRTESAVLRFEGSYGEGIQARAGGCRTRSSRGYSTSYYSSSYSPSRIISQVQPAYTEEARRNRTQGDVTLRVTLGADGTVGNVETITELPYGLTEQAEQAARRIKFIPAKLNGSAIDEVKTITYTFDLD